MNTVILASARNAGRSQSDAASFGRGADPRLARGASMPIAMGRGERSPWRLVAD